ncbi:MAG TPA: (Fe-S)-binding protein [Gemmatimonadota bacterium]|nr:(Fe-S)-binding protein [Gemmatimonadota bacterium]
MPDAAAASVHHTAASPAFDVDGDRLARCIQCGLCLPSCPTFAMTPLERANPRGRIGLMRAVTRGEMAMDDPAFAEAMYYCVGCRACETACPAGVEFGLLLEDARAAVETAGAVGRPAAFPRDLLLEALARPGRLRMGARLLRLYQRTLGRMHWWSRRLERWRPDIARFLSLAPPVPRQSRGRRIPAELAPADVAGESAPRARGTVALHPGCVQAILFPEVNADSAQVLAYNGWRVVSPEGFRCCGALHAHQGRREDARAQARANVAAFEESGAETLVSNAAGCGAFLEEYRELFRDDPEWADRATDFSARVVDVTEHLVGEGLRRPVRSFGIRVTYDDPCHLIHGQRVARAPRLALAAIPDLDVVPLAESTWCCGSAGIYNLTHPEAADQLGRRKIDRIVETGAEMVVTGNPGCMVQIAAGLRAIGSPVRVVHPVSLLRAAYELPALVLH